MEINSKHIKTDLANFWETARLVYQSDKRLFIIRLCMIVFQSILPLVSLYVLKLFIDGVTHSIAHPNMDYSSKIWLYASLFCVVYLLTRLSGIINQFCSDILSQKLIDNISNILHKKSSELDLAYYDNATYHDTFHRAQQEASFRPIQVLNDIFGLIGNCLSLIGTVAILFSFSWIAIVVMVFAGMPSLWVKLTKSKLVYKWRKANTPLYRKTNYFSMLLTNRLFAKEIRIFNLSEHFQKQFIAIRKKFVAQIMSISSRQAKLDMFSVALEVGALMAIILLLSHKAFSGAITIGSFVMFFEAFRRGQSYVQGLVSNLSGVYENKLFLGNIFEFLDLKPHLKSPENPIPFPKKILQGIRFENVSFTYPGTNKEVISDLNLIAKPGEVTLIKGENGAGKTTLIKLLCRLYDCTSGTIYIDNINIKKFDLHELQKNISVIFQDFVQFDLTVRENIGLGNIESGNNFGRMEQASMLSCADSVIEQLPFQYDTILGKYFEKGEELSMGQWQRIALGRTLFKDAPILILDEPTSWMDAIANVEFYQNINQLKKDKILLLISHSTNKEFEYTHEDVFTKSLNKQLSLT